MFLQGGSEALERLQTAGIAVARDGTKNGLAGRFPTQGYSWLSPRLGREPLALGMRSWLRWGLEQDGHKPLRIWLCE